MNIAYMYVHIEINNVMFSWFAKHI